MKKGILFLFLVAVPLLGVASHIVGGEFELIHKKDFQYTLNMVLYFDLKNGQIGARDPSASVRIFRKSDNLLMGTYTLPLTDETAIQYTQPFCSHGELQTSRLFYTTDIILSAARFSDPGGYYVAWERCCRNYGITNVYSEDTNNGGVIYAGQTFYLEFPPVTKDGQPFVDSTPRLFPPLNDFGCPRRPYYTDFGGIDDDGDSLVYSLTTPLNTKSADALPVNGTRPGPYPLVRYRAPFSQTNILGGNPDLHISHDGFLTVTPSQQGLFVFAVKVEEFRNKIKIGETRRDFQMLVVDACPIAVPPVIVGKKLTDAAYTNSPSLSVSYENTVVDDSRCINVRVSDADSESPDSQYLENVSIKAFPLNFKADVSGILPVVKTATLSHGSTVEFKICFPQCPYLYGGDPQIGIIAMDDACSLPLTDTLKVTVHVEPPFNNKPTFEQPTANPLNASLSEGTSQAWPFKVVDIDNDPLVVSVLTNGFALSTAGMTFTNAHQVDGEADGELKWDAYCDIYDFTHRTAFQVIIQAEDKDKCNIPTQVRTVFNLNVINLPDNAAPIIDTDLTPATDERLVMGLTRRVNESLKFKVTGVDPDNNLIKMISSGKDFTAGTYGVKGLTPDPQAIGSVVTDFEWDIGCTTVDLTKKDTFDFQFIVVDNTNKCHFYKTDTVDVEVRVLPPLNSPPRLTITDKNTQKVAVIQDNVDMTLGQPVQLLLTGTDADVSPAKDNLSLSLVKKDGTVAPAGFTFKNVTGTSPVESLFTWSPDCSIFEGGVYENDYSFTFLLKDDHCLTAKQDSLVLNLKIKDVNGSDANFLPPNFFSPNGDGVNDYFAMEIKDGTTGELTNILPLDNCFQQFEGVRIYNRWGNQVFQSSDRDFKWYGPGESAGVYFYFINFTKKEYRGSVSLRY